jgi:hypothetical protein
VTVADKIVELATAELGIRETGSNAGIPLERYGLEGDVAAPWCARFVRWVLSTCGVSIPGNQYKLGSVQYMEDRFRDLGWLVESPQPGDVVFFRSRIGSDAGVGRHVGIVTAVTRTTIKTVEGNSGDRVASRSYPFPCKSIASFGRPKASKE